MDSILISVKKMLGIEANYTHFDTDIILHTNTVFGILAQLGVGPSGGFSITGDSETWTDFLGDSTDLEMVKSYIFMKVRLLFDPPVNSAAIEAMKNLVSELEWRINVSVDPKKESW